MNKTIVVLGIIIAVLGVGVGIVLLHEHAYAETITTEATCETEGLKTFSCKCRKSYTEPIPATGHTYTEAVTTEPACETDGVKTFTCHCGDSYTEPIPAVGHVFEDYVFNNDATYFADGTETAKCNGCELTDTKTAAYTMLRYTYTPTDPKTMYAKQAVDIRDMPCEEGEIIDSLSRNDDVVILAQCNETGWYQIYSLYLMKSGYVPESSLTAETVKVQVQEEDFVTPETPWWAQGDGTPSAPLPPGQITDIDPTGGELIEPPPGFQLNAY